MRGDLRTRFWGRLVVNIGAPHECWDWPGGCTSAGYGALGVGGRGTGTVLAHRLAYELAHGPIPADALVHHDCANKKCCNPAHLELTTRREHPDSITTAFAARTHCPHGHEYSPANTYRDKKGRQCRACRARRARA